MLTSCNILYRKGVILIMEYVNELDKVTVGAAKKEAALKIHRLTFWEATMLVVGSTIGSGVLGLAYASRSAGWPVLLTWLVIAGFFSLVSMLYVVETTMRTKEPMQLSGLAQRYVGKVGSWAIFFSVGATSFCSLIAYTSGCGRILSELFGISVEMGSLLFAVPATVIVWLGLKATGVAEKFLSSGMVVLLILLVGGSFLSANVPVANILYANWKYAVPVFNITVFCYAVQYIVPELSRGLSHRPQQVVPSIAAAFLISLVILAVVPFAVFLMLPVEQITEVASIAWGKALGHQIFFIVVNLFAFCAMLTSYWAIAESFLTNMVERLGFKSETDIKTRAFCLITIAVPPFILAYSGLVSFVNAIFSAGTFGGIIMSIMPVAMLRSARKHGDQDPIWKCCGWISHPIMQGVVIAVFISAGIYALLSICGMLPAAW